MNKRIIGIDMATERSRVGLALADLVDDEVSLRAATLGSRREPPIEVIAGWLSDFSTPTLLAIDAPLGWPRALAESLAFHRAGEAIETPAHDMFRRQTDLFIHRTLGKMPLDVGADRIARTAHAALALLGELRRRLGVAIPLAWSRSLEGIAAIEVYPAATLVAHGLRSTAYKEPPQSAARQEILQGLSREIQVGEHARSAVDRPDVLDAIVCVLAGMDFLAGRALSPPTDTTGAEREGWIWSAAKRD